MKILYIIPTLERGGAEKDVALLATGLPSSFETVVYPFLGLGPLASSLPSSRIAAPQLDVTNVHRDVVRSRLSDKLAFVKGLGFAYPGGTFDIVHAVLPNSYVLAGLMRAMRPQLWRARLVMSRCGLNWHQERWAYWLGERMLHRAVLDHAVANCHAIARELVSEGIDEKRVTVIPNGINIDGWRAEMVPIASAKARLGIPLNTFTITCVGNLWPERKGQRDLISALEIAGLECEWILLFAGRDHSGYREQLEGAAASMGISDRVRFIGPRDDIQVVLSASDLHVSASHTEGLPNNILEAMAAGVAVVATDVGGTRDLVIEEVTGRLVPPRDPAALASAVRTLAVDSGYRERLGRSGLEHAKRHFGIQAFLDAHAALYRSLVDKQSVPRACY